LSNPELKDQQSTQFPHNDFSQLTLQQQFSGAPMHAQHKDSHSTSKRDSLKLIAGGFFATSSVLMACGGGSDSTATSTAKGTTTDPATTPATTVTATSNTLWIPPLLTGTTAAGVTSYELTLAASSVQFKSGAKTATYGYNGNDFWGPTLVMKKGSQARLQVKNSLAEDTTTHWHGMLVPGPVDGGPHQVVAAGATWLTEAFTVKNNAATYWYHPHMHEMTQKQLTLGAGGFIIVQDDAEAALNLPRTYGTDDIPLILTSRRFTTSNGVANQFQYTLTAYGDYLLTNGVMDAQVTLPSAS
jgi:blue copper oxidase